MGWLLMGWQYIQSMVDKQTTQEYCMVRLPQLFVLTYMFVYEYLLGKGDSLLLLTIIHCWLCILNL